MPEYSVALIGCGHRSRPHITPYREIDEAEVVACCAPSPTHREVLASEFDLNSYSDAREMIETEEPDLVHIITPPRVRVGVMDLVSELGVPACTVEKPIAIGVKDWRALCELEARSQTRFAVCHQLRWERDLTRCRETLQSGELGRVELLDFTAGMNISGQGTHILHYAMSLNGDSPVEKVFGSVTGPCELDQRHPAPAGSQACVRFENGVRGIWVNGSMAPRCGDPDVIHEHVRASARTQKGAVHWEEFGRWQIVSPEGARGESFQGHDVWEEKNHEAQTGFHRQMLRWTEDDAAEAGTNLKQSLHEWKAVLALYASALERRPVELADFDPEPGLLKEVSAAVNG